MEASHSDSLLSMSGIEKSFPGVRALRGANLQIAHGEVHGLVGENGAGKSTIIKVLAGIYSPEGGTVHVDGSSLPLGNPKAAHASGLRFIHQELQLVPHFTVAESVFLGNERRGKAGLAKREMRAAAARIMEEQLGLALDPDAMVRELGPAQRKLVQIARALTDNGVKLIVFDEPTAPLAATEVDQVLGAVRRLRDHGVSSLYVSHYLGEVTDLCDRVTVFRGGSDVGIVAEPHADSVQELITLMTGREGGELFPARGTPRDTVVVSAKGLSDGSAFADVDLSVRAGEVLGIAGLLGSGTEELVDSIVGLRKLRAGELLVSGEPKRFRSAAAALEHGVVLIPRDRRSDGLVLDQSVADNMSLSSLGAVSRLGTFVSYREVAKRARSMITQIDVRPPTPERKVRLLSGGNQQKVVIARALLTQARVVILDEPTVGVDIGAKAEIYRLVAELAANGTAVIVSSNDPSELLGLCHTIEVMVRGRIAGSFAADSLSRDALVAAMTANGNAEDTA